MNREILNRQMFGGGGAAFPDLSGDGKVTQKDILMGRGVVPMAGGGNVQYYENGGQTSFIPTAEGIAKQIALAFKMGGPQAGAQMRDRAIEMGADPSIANELFDSMMLSTSGALKNNPRFALSDMDAVESVLPKGDDMVSPDEMQRMQDAKFAKIRAQQAAMYDENSASNPTRYDGQAGQNEAIERALREAAASENYAYGGMVDPRMRQPVGMAEGGMMVDEGIGALPMGQGMDGPEVAMEQTLGAAAEGIGALDASQDYEQAINSVRGDQLPMEARYEELASFVGPNDAAQTPESVLALVQPVMQMAEVDQGIGSISPEAMGGEAPMTPEMAGGIMSNVPEAPPMDAGPPQPFNQGGVARDINDQVQYYADGGAVQYFGPGGEVDRDALYKTTQERYSKTLGQGENEAALSDAQKMAKSQMLFDIADTALRFASTPVGPGESIASVLAKSATESQLFPKIGQRAKGVQDLKTSQAKDQRSLNLAALQRSEQLGDAQVAAAATAAAAERASLDKPLKDTYEIIVNGETKLTLPLATMRDRREIVERIKKQFGDKAEISIKKLVERDKTAKIKNVLSGDGKTSLGTFNVNDPTQLTALNDIIKTNPGAYAVDGAPTAEETDTQNYQLPDGSTTTVIVGSEKADQLMAMGALAVSDDKPYNESTMARTQITLLKDVRVNGRDYKAGTHPNFNSKELAAIANTAGADAYTDYVKPITERDFFDKFKMSKAAFNKLSLENQQFLQGLPVLTDRDYFSKFGMTSAEFNQTSDFDKKVLLGIQPKYKYITSTDDGVTTTYRIDESDPNKLHEVVQGTDQKEYTYQTIKDGDTTKLLRFEKGSAVEPVEVASGTDTAQYEFREFKDGTTTKLMRFKKNDPADKGIVIMSGEDAPEYDFREISDGGKTRFIRTNKATGEVFEVLSATDTTKPSYMSVTLPDANNNLITTTVDVTTEAGRELITKANAIRSQGGNASVRKLSSERNTAQPYYNTENGDIVISYDGKTYTDPTSGEVKTIGGKFVPTDNRLTYDIYKREKISKAAFAELAKLDSKALATMSVPVYDGSGKVKLDASGVPVTRTLTDEEIGAYKNTLAKVRAGTGFWSKIYAGFDNVLGGVIAPKFFAKQFQDTTDGRMFVEALRVMGRSALSSSPRYAVADLQTVEQLFPNEKAFFRNPDTTVRKLQTLDQLLTEEKTRLLDLQTTTMDSKILSNAMSKIAEINKLQSMIGPIAALEKREAPVDGKTRETTKSIFGDLFN